ncbi:MAG: hypothetical protein ACE37E_11195 [Hyphomicrobiales bacterium]
MSRPPGSVAGEAPPKLTDHETLTLLGEGQSNFDAKTIELIAAHDDAIIEAELAEKQVDAQLDAPIEGRTPEAQERNRDKARDKKNAEAQIAPIGFTSTRFAAFAALFAGIVGGMGVEWTMFFQTFGALFANEFGELNAAGRFKAALWALQAVGVVLIFKLWAIKAQRMDRLIGVAFVAAVCFIVGAIIKHANAQIERATLETGASFSWDALPGEALANVDLFGVNISAYLLALGFLVVPIVSAALVSWGWPQLTKAMEGLAAARRYRRTYTAYKNAQRAVFKTQRALEAHMSHQETVVTASLSALVAEHIENARYTQARVKKQRAAEGSKLPIAGGVSPSSATSSKLDAEDAAARAALETLGNGYVKNAFTKWQAERQVPPP